MRTSVTLGVLFAVSVASCTSIELPPVERDADVKALAGMQRTPMRLAVAVAPLEIDVEGEIPPGAEAYAVAEDMASILEFAKVFGAVRAVPRLEDGRVALPPDADVLLRLRAHRLDVKFEGRNGYFWPNLLLWSALIVPAWWVPDETYSARVDLEAVAVSTRSGNPLGSHTASVSVKRDLDDFQRGWIPLGVLLAPGAFTSDNWERIGNALLRPALRKAEVDLARWLDDTFRKRVDSGEVASLTATTHALCVGVSKYRSLNLHNLKKPRGEARSLSDFLADPQLGGLRAGRVTTLLDDRATRPAVTEALERVLVEAPRPTDTVLVYFSGYGSIFAAPKGPEHGLLTYESEPGNAETPRVSLRDLADTVARSNAGRIVVVVDAGFAGGPASRASAPPPLFEKELHGQFAEMVLRGKGFVVLVERSGAGTGGDFLPDFTGALAGKGDLDADGAITGAELKEYFSRRPPGAGYAVRVFGEDLDKVRVPFGKGKVKK
jgi:hypothetical protein